MKTNNIKSASVFMAFLCMGFGDVVGPLTSQLQNEYQLSNFMAGLVTFMGFIMFGLLSVPMGLYQDRKGKKHVLIIGMIIALLGLVLPILGDFSSFALLLSSLLLLGTGATILQVSANPLMRDVSAAGKFSRNLSFGQFFKAIGSLSGALLPLIAAKYWDLDWKILFPIYSLFILITIISLLSVKIQEKKSENSKPASLVSSLALLKNSYVLMMVLAIFLYVGMEVCMSSKLPNYLAENFNYDIKELGLLGTLFFFIALMCGRFMGGIILNWISPSRFLIITSIISFIGIIGLYLASNPVFAFATIFIIGLGFANIFPLIFSLCIEKMPDRSNEISGLMVTAIIGGAIVPVIFGAIADMFSLMTAFFLCLLSVVYIIFLSFKTR